MQVEEWPISQIKPYKNNPRTNDEAVGPTANSIKEFGWQQPIFVDKNGVIIAGHTRLKAAKKLKLTKVPVVVAADLSDEQVQAYRLADNKTGELADWDHDLLDDELADILDIDMSDFGFDLLEDDDDEQEAVDDDFDEEPPEKPKSKLGDIYQLGRHRLMVGSSTDYDGVSKLMQGKTADVLFTSPPYGMGDNSKIHDKVVKGKGQRKSLYENYSDDNDEWLQLMRNFTEICMEFSKSQFIDVQMLANNKLNLVRWLYEYLDKLADIMIWDKQAGPPQIQDNVLTNIWEFIFIFNSDNPSRTIPFADFHGDKQNILRITRGKNEYADVHSAVFLIELPENIIKLTSQATTYLDPFGGTGTTLMACEQLGQTCYTMELSPAYCDLIINRWEKFTGQKAKKLN